MAKGSGCFAVSGFAVRGVGLCCKGFRTLGSMGVHVGGGEVATFVNPSNYNGSALLGSLGQVGSLIRNYGVANSVHLSGRGVCKSVSMGVLHGEINVIFRGTGPFPVDVCSGVTFNPHARKVGDGGRLSEVIRRSLHSTTV